MYQRTLTLKCEELLNLKENTHFEVKSAQGRDGNGEVPKDMWESYSAFANTEGGVILLGAKELDDGSLEILGIKDIEKVQTQVWTMLNNAQKVSNNILVSSNIEVITCEKLDLILIHVPRAERTQKPIYLGHNPLTGTYIRYHESDAKAKESMVKHFLSDAIYESNDTKVLKGFGINDLDLDSLAHYRNTFKSSKIDHPWIGLDELDFLSALGAYGKNRDTAEEGLTLAGLLMFGKMRSILDGVPSYIVDYQEHTSNPEDRWIDRVTTDGTWSGNLYDFALKSYRKLIEDLKVPFRLDSNSQRIDETHVHQALREALINTLIHGNYDASTGILIVKHPQRFFFRNPGLLRVSLLKAQEGGQSDCRNRTLQKMFQLIGWGEQAGSGFPKMKRAWSEQHWQRPLLVEDFQDEFTTLNLPTVSLIPKEVEEQLQIRFGDIYNDLNQDERLVLVIAEVEGAVTNNRVNEITELHPSDISKLLRQLVDKRFLFSDGFGRGMTYKLGNDASSLQHWDESLQHLRNVQEVRAKKKTSKETMHKAIQELCDKRYMSVQELASLLHREVTTLRNHYIGYMLKEGMLETKHKDVNHPQQMYKTKKRIDWNF